MGEMTDTHRRFFRENPRHEIKWETVQTEYLKWLEDLAREQLAYNDALQLVRCRCNCKELKTRKNLSEPYKCAECGKQVYDN